PIEKLAIPYLIFTVLGVIFNTLNLAMLAPLLNTLFNTSGTETSVQAKPENWTDVFGYLNYYAQQANLNYGPLGALQLVCGVIILSVLLGNLFRYLSERVMENLRIHTLLNLRKRVFDNVMN